MRPQSTWPGISRASHLALPTPEGPCVLKLALEASAASHGPWGSGK